MHGEPAESDAPGVHGTMKLSKLLPLLALFVCGPAHAVADAVLVNRGVSTGSTCSTAAGSVSAGDTIIGVVSFDSAVTITVNTLSGSGANNFGAATAAVTTASEGKISLFVVQNATGGASVTWSLTFSGTAFPVCHLIKLTGVDAASLDAASLVTSTTDNASPWTVTSNAFAQANNVVIAGIVQGCGSDGTWASSNFTVVSGEGSLTYWPSAVGKLVVSSTSAVTPSWTHTGSTSCVAPQFVIGFKEAAGGGGSGQPPRTMHQFRLRNTQ